MRSRFFSAVVLGILAVVVYTLDIVNVAIQANGIFEKTVPS